MANVQAFHGLRYDLGHVGSLSDVVAPPYDVIDAELQRQLYDRHPCNVVRLILNREEPGDNADNNRYTRAAGFLRSWLREGVLQKDTQAAIYAYHQVFSEDDVQYCRRGFMCCVGLERIGEGNIYPHEETHSAAKEDRFNLTKACHANLSQIFGLYPDETNEAANLVDFAIEGKMPLEATDHLGVIHRIWPVRDVKVISELCGIMGPKPIFIADGHHRYETACNYRDWFTATHQTPADHAVNSVLMMCVGMSDPGMIVLPTHRLFRGLPPVNTSQLSDQLAGFFDTTLAGEGPDRALTLWTQIESDGDQGNLAFYCGDDQRWLMATITDQGRSKMTEIAPDQSSRWRGLGISILHRLVMETLLDANQLPKPMYVHSVQEVVDGLVRGDTVGRDATGQEGQGGDFPLAALVMPASLEHVQEISRQGQRMPAKSTYFYPKLLSGLVINPHE